ncbi:MAG: U32 family peptidase [Acholeplasmatales bacterium]|nr:U32 family peptidase [Acholeplasmatales bacterium]
MRKVELLAPAGDLEKLKVAVLYGADAVFIGGLRFSLRARASNFTIDDIKEGCRFAHEHNAKIHVTCNILPHEIDVYEVREYLHALEDAGVDAIICASPLIITEVLKTKMECHVSTQESTINSSMVKFWESLGVQRVVLGRELDLKSIKEIKENCNVDIESFIHGGMCVSYSGRCMLSNNMTNRDANRGGCAHSCRWNYNLYVNGEKINKDDFFAMSSKDMCSMPVLKEYLETGIDSFKIEGRMKSLHYIATIVRAYRKAIDEYYETGDIKNINQYIDEISKAENRETSIGFLKGMTTVNEQLYDLFKEKATQDFIGTVLDYDADKGYIKLDVRNYFDNNVNVVLFTPEGDKYFTINEILNDKFEPIECANHPRDIVYIKSPYSAKPYDILRLTDAKED